MSYSDSLVIPLFCHKTRPKRSKPQLNDFLSPSKPNQDLRPDANQKDEKEKQKQTEKTCAEWRTECEYLLTWNPRSRPTKCSTTHCLTPPPMSNNKPSPPNEEHTNWHTKCEQILTWSPRPLLDHHQSTLGHAPETPRLLRTLFLNHSPAPIMALLCPLPHSLSPHICLLPWLNQDHYQHVIESRHQARRVTQRSSTRTPTTTHLPPTLAEPGPQLVHH